MEVLFYSIDNQEIENDCLMVLPKAGLKSKIQLLYFLSEKNIFMQIKNVN